MMRYKSSNLSLLLYIESHEVDIVKKKKKKTPKKYKRELPEPVVTLFVSAHGVTKDRNKIRF